MVTMKDLLECGVHFGHQTRRWNPKIKKLSKSQQNNNKSVVLILGKGDESAQISGDKKFEFSDKDEVLKILEVRD